MVQAACRASDSLFGERVSKGVVKLLGRQRHGAVLVGGIAQHPHNNNSYSIRRRAAAAAIEPSSSS
jgi:hypothetical protein